MIARSEPTGTKAPAPLFHLEVSLIGCKPRIWRRLQVPGNANLGWLHAVIQVAMGWTNSHLHLFRIDRQIYADPKFELDEFGTENRSINEHKTLLMHIAPRQGSVIHYEYDFGDSWEHEIKVNKVLDPDPAAARSAICLKGARACPPEDCGGIWGYAELLQILQNPKHPEYQERLEWLGGRIDPEAFDLDYTNEWLSKLKWPRTTEDHLRKVLMGRDQYIED